MPALKTEPKAEPKPKEDPKVVIPRLLKQLENSDDQHEKRKLRNKLRHLGHYGGVLRKDDGLTKPKPEKKVGKRAAVGA